MITNPSDHEAILTTQQWVEKFVIGENVCPFAGREFASDRIRFCLTETDQEHVLLEELAAELALLNREPSIETSLLIHPNALVDFLDYNDFLQRADDLLSVLDLEGTFQIASFHPNYQFAGTHQEDAENFTNRSPFPMLHILREASVSRAVESHPAIEEIPQRNIQRMNEMGVEKLKSLLK